MLACKAMYKKLMDDLKDSGMWLDWAMQIKEKHRDIALFLGNQVEHRLKKCYPEGHKYLVHLYEVENKKMDVADELLMDELEEWYKDNMCKLEKLEKSFGTKAEHEVHEVVETHM